MKHVSTASLALCLPLLVSCGLSPFSKGGQSQAAKLPDTRGWGLMMDPALTGTATAAGEPGTPPPLPPGAGGAVESGGGGLFDFSSVTGGQGAAASRVPWVRSATDATEMARRTGKPLLILINNRRSPSGQSIESTLVLQPEFRRLAEESFIPLRLDYADEKTKESDFYQAFKNRLKVRGYPTILVTLPDGSEILRLSGFKHEYEVGYLVKLRDSVANCEKAIQARRDRMTGTGYRLWTDKNGVPVFAKLEGVDANMGAFTGEWGNPFKTFTTRLSEEDQAWIAQQQAKSRKSRES